MEALDITQIIEAILTLIIAVAGTYYTYMRRKASNAEQLDKWVKLAVGAAEQAYKLSLTDDRKTFAKEWLEKKGVTINWDKLDDTWDDIDMAIEAAVNELPPVQRTATSETMLDGKGA